MHKLKHVPEEENKKKANNKKLFKIKNTCKVNGLWGFVMIEEVV